MTRTQTGRPLQAGLTIGIGMGGFVDGILFHQILQIHSMLSARIPNTDIVGAKVNMVWDGVFHAAVWMVTAVGITMLRRAGGRQDVRWSGSAFAGSLLMGWGLFNLVEGILDHHVLQLHHVYEPWGLSVWDYAFLGWGAVMMLAGLILVRRR